MVLHPAVSSRTMKHHPTVGGEEHSGRVRVAEFCLLKMPWAGGRGVKGIFALPSVWANSCLARPRSIFFMSVGVLRRDSPQKASTTDSLYLVAPHW